MRRTLVSDIPLKLGQGHAAKYRTPVGGDQFEHGLRLRLRRTKRGTSLGRGSRAATGRVSDRTETRSFRAGLLPQVDRPP